MWVTRTNSIRLWTLGLAALAALATLLIIQISPLEVILVALVILTTVTVVGLMTNAWIGLLAGALGVLAMLLGARYTGVLIQPTALASMAGALASILLVGPLAGGVSSAVDRAQREADHWLARAEDLAVHDETLHVLKPEWGRLRLEEEALRAAHFGRPLAVALLQLTSRSSSSARAERLAALQAVLRVARAALPPAAVVAHAGADQLLLILPEHTLEQGRRVVEQVWRQASAGHYFPSQPAAASLGQPVQAYGTMRAGLAALNGRPENATELLARAQAAMQEEPCLN